MKKVAFIFTLIFVLSSITIYADERPKTYYATNGNYYHDNNYWWNYSHQMHTRASFKFNEIPNGVDYNAAKYEKGVSHDYVTTYVKNADGEVKIGPHSKSSYAKIGAKCGTDYHKYKE